VILLSCVLFEDVNNDENQLKQLLFNVTSTLTNYTIDCRCVQNT